MQHAQGYLLGKPAFEVIAAAGLHGGVKLCVVEPPRVRSVDTFQHTLHGSMINYWLFKSEPDAFAWSELVAKGAKGEPWTGVRNYLARNNMRAMKVGDRGFFYHSNEGREIVGICEVIALAHPDATTTRASGSAWTSRPLLRCRKPVTLADVKANPKLEKMSLVTSMRLSVQPVTAAEWKEVCRMGGFKAEHDGRSPSRCERSCFRRGFHSRQHALARSAARPEIKLHLAEESLPIWQKTEEELGEINVPPPFWAFAWAGGQALARYLLDAPELMRGKRVLDLGTGSGLTAIAAALCGARSVIAADIDRLAVQSAEINARENGVSIETTTENLLLADRHRSTPCSWETSSTRSRLRTRCSPLSRWPRRRRLGARRRPEKKLLPSQPLHPRSRVPGSRDAGARRCGDQAERGLAVLRVFPLPARGLPPKKSSVEVLAFQGRKGYSEAPDASGCRNSSVGRARHS